ncbi:GDSL esterase/lipase At1g71250-like [Wolffia australiana]
MERIYFLFLAMVLAVPICTPISAAASSVAAVFVFGDSTVDVGNNNFLTQSPAKSNFPPYGLDLPSAKATGRFSNGYVGVDYSAKRLGFNESPPPWFSIAHGEQVTRGVNFASAASGIFDTTGANISIPLSQQISYFDVASRQLRNRIGSRAARHFLSKSIYYMSTGNNDLILSYTKTGILSGSQQKLLITQLADEFKNRMKGLHKQGARKFLVFGTSLIGCIPILRLTVPGDVCVEYLNQLSQQFNNATVVVLRDLASDLKGFSYSFINIYDYVSLISSKPRQYGFTEVSSACCGLGRLNAQVPCSANTTYCSNRDNYFYWDQFHPTQAFYAGVTRAAFQGRRYASPVTIKQLVRL